MKDNLNFKAFGCTCFLSVTVRPLRFCSRPRAPWSHQGQGSGNLGLVLNTDGRAVLCVSAAPLLLAPLPPLPGQMSPLHGYLQQHPPASITAAALGLRGADRPERRGRRGVRQTAASVMHPSVCWSSGRTGGGLGGDTRDGSREYHDLSFLSYPLGGCVFA